MNAKTLRTLGLEPVEVGRINGRPTYKVKIKDLSQTVDVIRGFILENSHNPRLRVLVSKILKPCKSKDFLCYVERIVDYVRRHVKYVDDPQRLELLQSPERTLKLRIGDCDDFTILTGTLLRLAGFPIRIVLGDPNRDGRYEHVYLKVMLPNKTWLTVDPTVELPFKPKDYPEKEIKVAERSPLLSGELIPGTRCLRCPHLIPRPVKPSQKPAKEKGKMGLLDSILGKLSNIEVITPKYHYGLFKKDGTLQVLYTKKPKQRPQRPIRPTWGAPSYQESSVIPKLPSPSPTLLIGGALLFGALFLAKRR